MEIIRLNDGKAFSSVWQRRRQCTRGPPDEGEPRDSQHNRGLESTFVTSKALSIIDVTLTNLPASSCIFDWCVNTSLSCSDHRYLEYKFRWQTPLLQKDLPNLRKGNWDSLGYYLGNDPVEETDLDLSKEAIDTEGELITSKIREAILSVCPK